MDFLSLGKEPISADQPTGSDVRYEPEFEELQAEIDKLSSPSASETMDWSKVEKLASEILATKAKDLLVASYFAVAQVHTNQVEGFAAGLGIYRDLLDQYWEGLFPAKKRMRGRIAAIEWWLEKGEGALMSLEVAPLPAERIKALRQDIQQIDNLLREHLDEPPLLRPLERFLESVPIQAEKKSASEPETSPTPKEASAASTAAKPRETAPPSATTEPGEIASVVDAEKVLDAAISSIRRAGAYLLGENLANAQGYRWRRVASWTVIDAVPAATDGQTIVPPPDAGIRSVLEELKEKGNWEALAESAEQRVPEYIFWFDLNRFVAEALAGLGDSYQDAIDALCHETAAFVYRLAGVERLSFSDGTPFADADTQQWLKGINLGGGAGVAGPVEDGGGMAEAIEKAQGLAKKKKLAEAVLLLQDGLRGSFSGKQQLLWRLGLSQLLLNAKKPHLALPHLESMLQDIDRYELEQWDPDLALKGLEMVWIGFGARSDEAGKEQATVILNRIAKIAPAEALRLAK